MTPSAATPPPAPINSAGRIDPEGGDCPDDHPIKGNKSSSGELIYHEPGNASYDRTDPEACFATDDDAEDAGYRRALR